MHYRKFSPVDRRYPIFEFVDGDVTLFDISKDNDGQVEIAFHNPISAKIFAFEQFSSLIKEGFELAVQSLET